MLQKTKQNLQSVHCQRTCYGEYSSDNGADVGQEVQEGVPLLPVPDLDGAQIVEEEDT